MSAAPVHYILLSARDEPVMAKMVSDLLQFALALSHDDEETLQRIAYTLQVGRDQMDVRLAVRASSLEELRDALEALLEPGAELGVRRRAASTLADDAGMAELVQSWLAKREIAKLVDLWLTGIKIDWKALYAAPYPRRINLPSYPFNLQRYWITESRGVGRRDTQRAAHDAAVKVAAVESAKVEAVRAPTGGKHNLFTLPDVLSDRELDVAPMRGAEARAAQLHKEPAMEILPVKELRRSDRTELLPVAAAARAPAITLGALQDDLARGLAAALFMEEGDIDLDETFFELGVESVSGVEWIKDLSRRYGITVKVSAIYDAPTLRTFSEYLYDKLNDGGAEQRLLLPPDESDTDATIVEYVEPRGERAVPKPAASAPVAMLPESNDPLPAAAETILATLSEVLLIDPMFFDADMPFDEMGLDARSMRQLLQRLTDALAVVVTADDVIGSATPRALARRLDEVRAGRQARDAVAMAPALPAASARSHGSSYGLVIAEAGSVADVAVRSIGDRAPGGGEIAIAVKASAVNFADILCVTGLYPTMPDYPFVAGLEVAGVVSAVGANVTRLAVGDEVIAVAADGLGGHASRLVVPATHVARKPRNLTFEEAASLPVAFLTMRAAYEAAHLGDGQSVLLHAAAGGCGLMGIQLARLQGCRIYASSSKHDKRWKLKRIGIDDLLDYTQPFDARLAEWTNGRGVDVVVNTVSGLAIQRGLNALAASGTYVELAVRGFSAERKLDLSRLVDNQSILSLDLRRMLGRPGAAARLTDALSVLVEMAEDERIVPIVSRIYPLRAIGDALTCVSFGEHIGKVVIRHGEASAINCEETCLARMESQRRMASRFAGRAAKAPPIARTQGDAAPDAIAIIGMQGQFPMANDVAQFWRNLAEGRSCISGLPYERWSMKRPENGEAALYPFSGILDEADLFDPLFFAISPKEARFMDPQQRIFLQNSWACIEDAGYAPGTLSGTRCGVFAGCSGAGYGFGRIQETSTHVLMGHTNSILPARISYHLNLKGPCMAIDTACSSALVAVAEACTSLAFGGCDLALAGGVSVFASPIFSKMAQEGGMLSEDGRCFTFDNRANGFVPAEGVGVFLLKRLADAERDGDRIHGVIRGWGVNHDGKTNGMTAPSAASQTALEREVYDRFGIDPETISYVEAHGTGTKLGDPIEILGLTEAFRAYTDKKQYCAIGSVKSNIGHALGAAAAAGMLKVLLAMAHKKLPPSINYERSNEEIPFAESPFFVNDRLRDWTIATGPARRAAISSFSYNGTNAHVVIDEYLPSRQPLPQNLPASHAIVLSAKAEDRLREQAGQLCAYAQGVLAEGLSESERRLRLRNIAYTLQVGRDAMVERLCFVASSIEDLVATLRAVASGQTPGNVMLDNTRASRKSLDREDRAQADRRNVLIRDALARQDLEPLLRHWMEGATIDWASLYAESRPERIALPTYPFAKRRYWFDQKETVEAAPSDSVRPFRPVRPARPEADDPYQQRFVALLGRRDPSSAVGAI